MKKKIIILALIMVSGISLLRSQPVTALNAADMKLIKSKAVEITITREGNNLGVSAQAYQSYTEIKVEFEYYVRIKFTGNARNEFETFAGGAEAAGQLKLKLVNETSGKSYLLTPDKNGGFYVPSAASADQDWEEFTVTFNEFKLNGHTIGTGYKPKRN